MKISIIELNRLLGDASSFRTRGFSDVSIGCRIAENILSELIAAREVVDATEKLLARPEVKAAALMAPALSGDINRLKQAMKDYKAK